MSNDDRIVSEFDRIVAGMDGLNDVIRSKPTTIAHTNGVTSAANFTVQTFRHRELGDTVALTYVGPEGHWRIALPPKVAAVIHRQSDALSTKLRRNLARAHAAERKANGWKPSTAGLEAARGKPRSRRKKRARRSRVEAARG